MNEYNAAFFGLFENVFLTLKENLGPEQALTLFRKIMVNGLKKAYGTDFIKGEPLEFQRIVIERDNNVGLKVDCEFTSPEKQDFYYRFYDYPFPNLKDHIESKDLDDTFINFKVNYLLGENWSYKTTKHIWNGDGLTEFLVYKNQLTI